MILYLIMEKTRAQSSPVLFNEHPNDAEVRLSEFLTLLFHTGSQRSNYPIMAASVLFVCFISLFFSPTRTHVSGQIKKQ